MVIGFTCISSFLFAQDTLYRSDGTRQAVKIIEVHESQVKYKMSSKVDGPMYVVNKEDIKKIVYENGATDTFPILKSINAIQKDPRSIDFGRNFISLNMTDLFLGSLTIGYERTFKSGNYSIRCPLSLGLISLGLASPVTNYSNTLNQFISGLSTNSYSGYYNRDKIFSTGLDFYYYNSGQGKSKFYFGPSLEFGQFNYWTYDYDFLNAYNYKKEQGTYYAFLLQTGFLLQPDKHLNISINAGLGYANTVSARGTLAIRGGISMGYKF